MINKLERLRTAFIRSDPDRFFHFRDENLSITDLSSPRGAQDCIDGALCAIVRHHHLEFHFRQEIHRVLGATINFAVTFLPTKAFDLTQSHSLHPHCHERFFYRLGFKGLDDSFDFLHRAKLEPALQMASGVAVVTRAFPFIADLDVGLYSSRRIGRP